MKSIIEKLSPEEIKQLSKAINEAQKDFFGNSLGLRKQEDFMAKVFNQKNWNTLVGLSKKFDLKSYYEDCKRQRKKCLVTESELNSTYLEITAMDEKNISFIRKVKRDDSVQVDEQTTSKEAGIWNELLIYKRYNPKAEYQKTTLCVEVLSNGFYNDPNDLSTLHHDITYGDCSGSITNVKREALSRDEMRDALLNQGSDPSFLVQLDTREIEYLDGLYARLRKKLKYDHNVEDKTVDELTPLMMELMREDEEYFSEDDVRAYLNSDY